MRRFHNLKTWLRLLVAVGLIGVVATGVTYAALQSQAANVTGNTINSAAAALIVGKDGATYNTSMVGYDFNGLIPGGSAMPSQNGGYNLWLKNNGSAPLSLNVHIGNAPTVNGDIDLSKVFVVLTPVGGGGASQTTSVAALIASKTSGGTAMTTPALNAGTAIQYKIQVQMSADAFSGSSASISNLDLVFGGTASTQ